MLIFNQQGHREAIPILEGLYAAVESQGLIKLDYVIFCPASSSTDTALKKGKRSSFPTILGCLHYPDFVNKSYDATAISGLTMQKAFAERWQTLDSSPETTIEVLPSIEDALEYVRKLGGDASGDQTQVHALITGSVHLVGRALGVLEGVDAL